MTVVTRCSFLFLLSILGACGDKPTAAPPAAAASPQVQKLLLAADPGAAEAVRAAKAKGARDQVVVFGRIASVLKGYAAFTLMDTGIPYCGEVDPKDHCKTPWDYCCESSTTRTANALLVEVRGDDGKPLATPGLPDLRLLDAVKVTGRLTADEHGNMVLQATGFFRTERPKVPDDLEWPQ